MENKHKRILWISACILVIILLLFPTENSTWDAYVYAAQAQYNVDLLSPHHLLYKPLLKIFRDISRPLSLDFLELGKLMNAIFQLMNLCLLYQILKSYTRNIPKAILYTFFVAVSFSTLRFGTENETYVVPIFYSLLGSLFYLKFIQIQKNYLLILSGFFAAFACLFHQIHIFWLMGLGIGLFLINPFRIKYILLFALPTLVVPVIYLLVLNYLNIELTWQNFFDFTIHDYKSGYIQTTFDWKSFYMLFVSFVRTFIQIHPLIFTLLTKNWLYILPIVIGLIWVFKIIRGSLKFKIQNSKFKIQNSKKFESFNITHFIIFVLQLIFSAFNHGNVEFMVMLPFLTAILLIQHIKISEKTMFYSCLVLLIWNFTFGILPNHIYKFYNYKPLVNYIALNPEEIYVVQNRNVNAQYFYQTGIDNYKTIIPIDKISREQIDSILTKKAILTDVIDFPEIYNREKMFQKSGQENLFNGFKKDLLFKTNGLFGRSLTKPTI